MPELRRLRTFPSARPNGEARAVAALEDKIFQGACVMVLNASTKRISSGSHTDSDPDEGRTMRWMLCRWRSPVGR
jgi:hypothetical protein